MKGQVSDYSVKPRQASSSMSTTTASSATSSSSSVASGYVQPGTQGNGGSAGDSGGTTKQASSGFSLGQCECTRSTCVREQLAHLKQTPLLLPLWRCVWLPWAVWSLSSRTIAPNLQLSTTLHIVIDRKPLNQGNRAADVQGESGAACKHNTLECLHCISSRTHQPGL